MLGRIGMRCALVAALTLGTASAAFAAEDGVWSVSKATGEVWVATDGAQQVSLNQEATLKPGNTIRTGRNGRVLLVRGEETILISPNSVVGLPSEKKEGLSTTIIQRAGSILLEVEKRNVKHFEVETPYLAAVVKGTQFSVTVGAGSTKVGVLRGQVEVSDFKTGQIAQVMPGQAATVFEHGKPGLSLSGAGTFNPIEHGKPRASTIERVPVPKSGLSAPRNAASGHAIHALGPIDKGAKAAGVPKPSHQAAGGHVSKAGVVRISSSLGEVRLNVHKVTNGLAHDAVAPGQVRNANASAGPDTVWSDGKSNTPASNSSVQTAATTSGAAAAGSSASAASAAIAAAAAGASSDSPGANNANSGGNGNSGNNGNGNSGNNGNGNHGATGNGRGNNGNGSGNGGGNGHGNAYGHNRR
ncbi:MULTISPECIES: FecR family protein [Bradyrhizobium]|uniref:FecR protein domain-containing protein n=3 Tax=Bradyrhizobium TaxID=374 RepID=A0ABV4G5X8_9BRAD|nr:MULTISPECIES: FecR family protein [Bradyrhizobium]MBR1291427.1 FecR domain-containing protein [Bradyrhizobium ottawaense]MDA9413577.1 membrane protein [Bradyrhizobium sp. CCBAU 25360]MDA9481229.1 membrane protein [Bradyrhizobium sp. CCBAU 11445]WLB44061.1 FecR family protein [Bradyrhizobium ottawaense]WQN81362.1 FecR family protein [Bradyrhizobium ottawaense]